MSSARSRPRKGQPQGKRRVQGSIGTPRDQVSARLSTDVPSWSGGSRVVFLRHVAMAAVTALLVFGFWSTRMEWTVDMRLWRAVGDAAIVLLFAALALGPLAKLSAPYLRRLTPFENFPRHARPLQALQEPKGRRDKWRRQLAL